MKKSIFFIFICVVFLAGCKNGGQIQIRKSSGYSEVKIERCKVSIDKRFTYGGKQIGKEERAEGKEYTFVEFNKDRQKIQRSIAITHIKLDEKLKTDKIFDAERKIINSTIKSLPKAHIGNGRTKLGSLDFAYVLQRIKHDGLSKAIISKVSGIGKYPFSEELGFRISFVKKIEHSSILDIIFEDYFNYYELDVLEKAMSSMANAKKYIIVSNF